MRALLIASGFLAMTVPALAGSTYDYQSGNFYYWNNSGGTTHLYGSNSSTGSNWNSTIRPNGNMNGTDSDGNYWNYNAGTKTYFNSNGTTCFGSGALRTCY